MVLKILHIIQIIILRRMYRPAEKADLQTLLLVKT